MHHLLYCHKKSLVRAAVVCMLFVITVPLMGISPVTVDYKLNANSNSTQESTLVGYSALRMDLAKIINRYTGRTWNQSQQVASRIIELIVAGSSVTTAIGLVLGVVTGGVATVLALARALLVWYIKKKGRRAAVMW